VNNSLSLIQLIQKRREEGSLDLPVFDRVANEVYRAVQANRSSAKELVQLLEEDPAIAGEVLRVANSSFFSGLGEITRLSDAIVRLGNKQIASLALAASQKRMYSESGTQFGERLVLLWRHSNAVAFGSRWLTEQLGLRHLADEAFLAGLLHDVGKMSLLRIIEDLIAEMGDDLPLSDAVLDTAIQQLHPQHGADLLSAWNLPELFCRVVADHHHDHPSRDNEVLLIVRLVDLACTKEGIGERHEPDLELNSCVEAGMLGLDDFRIAELQVILEDAAALSA
jgi:putative nucleotidyltransferase with HDIG domain